MSILQKDTTNIEEKHLKRHHKRYAVRSTTSNATKSLFCGVLSLPVFCPALLPSACSSSLVSVPIPFLILVLVSYPIVFFVSSGNASVASISADVVPLPNSPVGSVAGSWTPSSSWAAPPCWLSCSCLWRDFNKRFTPRGSGAPGRVLYYAFKILAPAAADILCYIHV